jgi:hypothetical protein
MADQLPENAKLRKHAMFSYDALLNKMGSSCSPVSISDGFSSPTMYNKGVGDDVAFPMSYSEAANFCSLYYSLYNPTLYNVESPKIAVKNFNKLRFPLGYVNGIWLRSPGGSAGEYTVAAMDNDDIVQNPGRVNRYNTSRAKNGKINTEFGLVLPAVWVDQVIMNAKTITYNPNGGKGEILKDDAVYNIDYVVWDNPGYTKDRYDFNGWNTEADGSGELYLGGDITQVTDNTTFYAQWEPDPLTVTYYPNGGDGGIFVDNTAYERTYTIKDQVFSKRGYRISGWKDGSGKSYSINERIIMKDNLTLYAQWTIVPILVHYDPNGGEGEYETEITYIDTSYTLKDQGYSKEYFEYEWCTLANGTGKKYAKGETIFIDSVDPIFLYAIWIPII